MPAVGDTGADPLVAWLDALERRHLADLTLPEVRRALQALSSLYVARRVKLPTGAALDGAGKRAAFALFYGPLHFLTVRAVVRELGAAPPGRLLDLGCGTGAAGAAWALEAARCEVRGVDLHPWAVEEAAWTYRALGLRGTARRGHLERIAIPQGRAEGVLLGWTVNELEETAREGLLASLVRAAGRGTQILVVEPVARGITPWWSSWSRALEGAGGRADSWRFPVELPPRLRLLDRAAGLDHRLLTARTLYLGSGAANAAPADRTPR
jgi:SAM-dependent methyltransferase